MKDEKINLTLKIWRQESAKAKGNFEEFKVAVSPHSSVLEMFDELNNKLELEGKIPIAFESDCREGICGTCGLVINGHPHGNKKHTATCQMHMRSFKEGEVVYIEPFRASAFPILRDLMVDRSGLDTIQQAGGYVSFNTGSAPDANAIPISKENAEESMDAASCIGCGACVATCKNSSAMLFLSAKVSQLALLPQGKIEASRRAKSMLATMDELGFGNCSNTGACEVECPKGISIAHIARFNREFLVANLKD